MRWSLHAWMVVVILLGTMVYAVAEDFSLTTYYPSPRGVYQALRVGSGTAPSPMAHLQIMHSDASLPLSFRVDHNAAGTDPVVIDASGRLGIGSATPSDKLTIIGGTLRVPDAPVVVVDDPKVKTIQPGMALITDPNNPGKVVWGYAVYAPAKTP